MLDGFDPNFIASLFGRENRVFRIWSTCWMACGSQEARPFDRRPPRHRRSSPPMCEGPLYKHGHYRRGKSGMSRFHPMREFRAGGPEGRLWRKIQPF